MPALDWLDHLPSSHAAKEGIWWATARGTAWPTATGPGRIQLANVSGTSLKLSRENNENLLTAIDCKRPNDIENGRIIIVNDVTTYGGSAEYHCIPLYNRIGPYLRKCKEDGQWSGDEPRCECKKFSIALCNRFIHCSFFSGCERCSRREQLWNGRRDCSRSHCHPSYLRSHRVPSPVSLATLAALPKLNR